MKKLFALAMVLLVLSAAVFAQGEAEAPKYPTRTINLVVPFNPGGSTDLTNRAIASGLQNALGGQINVTNTPGAGSATGTMSVINAPADGYTMLGQGILSFTTLPVASNGAIKQTYKEWEIWIATYVPNAICVGKNSPYNTIEDLIADMQKRPGEITFGTGGNTSGGRFGTEVLNAIAGSPAKHIPYNGGAAAKVALLSGEIDVCPQLVCELYNEIIAGDVKCLAVLSAEDIEIAPGVVCPSILKSYPNAKNIPMGEYTAVMVKKGTPANVVEALDKAFEATVNSAEFKDFCAQQRFTVAAMGREEAQKFLNGFAPVAANILWEGGAADTDPATVGLGL